MSESRLIFSPDDYRIADFVLVDGAGPAFTGLSWKLGHFDPSWKKAPRKPWHVAFLSRWDSTNGWWVSEAKGGDGITENRLRDFENPYLVFRWFDRRITATEVQLFIDQYRGEKYDAFFGYLFVIVWYFWKWWPFIIDRKWMCWEWLWFFALSFGKPIDNIHKYPLITILMDKVGYPGYE